MQLRPFDESLDVAHVALHHEADATATQTSDLPKPKIDPSTPPPELDGIGILIVEDDEDSRELIREVLMLSGAVVTTAADAKAALALLAERAFDVIVSDIGLPEVDGLQFMRTLRATATAAGVGTPAIALTAFTRAQDRAAVLQAGFQAHVSKPVDLDELIAMVTSALNQSGRRPS